MFKIRKATLEDIEMINRLAWIVFPHTYKEILSPEQMEYMMDWMYSPENLHKQMTEDGALFRTRMAIRWYAVRVKRMFRSRYLITLTSHSVRSMRRLLVRFETRQQKSVCSMVTGTLWRRMIWPFIIVLMEQSTLSQTSKRRCTTRQSH